MSVHKQSVSFADAAFSYAKDRVDQSDYPNVSAAVSRELVCDRALRERDAALLAAEVKRRAELPPNQWEKVANPSVFMSDAWAFLDDLDL